MWVRLGACHWSRRTSPQPFAPRGKGRFARVRGARQSADWLRPRSGVPPPCRKTAASTLSPSRDENSMRNNSSRLVLAAKDKISPRHGCTNALRLELRGTDGRDQSPWKCGRFPETKGEAEAKAHGRRSGRGRRQSRDCRTPVTQGATCACARASTAGNRTRLSATRATHAISPHARHPPSHGLRPRRLTDCAAWRQGD